MTPENVDFYWNLIEFHFNVISQKEGSVGIFSRLEFYVPKIHVLLGAEANATDPVTFFKTHFLAKYQLSNQSNEAKSLLTISEEDAKRMEAADSDEEVVEEVIDDEDKVAKTDPSFRIWQNSLFAQNNCMRIILKFADYLDKSSKEGSSDDDDDFEDCEEMDEDSAAQAQVIDLDSSK